MSQKPKMSTNELAEAFKIWERFYLKKTEGTRRTINSASRLPWVKRARKSLFLSTQTLADRLGISRQAYSRLENAEQEGNISIKNLRRIAEAMDCELVYSFRPKGETNFSQVVWKKLLPKALRDHKVINAKPKERPNRLAYVALYMLRDPELRKKNGWSQGPTLL